MMIIDSHVHYEPRILNAEAILNKMSLSGIDKAVLIPNLTDPPETEKPEILMRIQRLMFFNDLLRPIAAEITKSMYKKKGEWNIWFHKYTTKKNIFKIVTSPDNNSIAELINKYPLKFMGWIFINPQNSNALDELEKWRLVRGMIGIKIHPFWHHFPMEKAVRVARRAQELKLPLLVHLGFGQEGNYQWLVENFPNLKIIFAHAGIPFYKKMWPVVKNSSNLFIDLSSTYHVDKSIIKCALGAVGANKCIFGSDAPYGHNNSIGILKKWIDELTLSDREKERIYSMNFLEIISHHI